MEEGGGAWFLGGSDSLGQRNTKRIPIAFKRVWAGETGGQEANKSH